MLLDRANLSDLVQAEKGFEHGDFDRFEVTDCGQTVRLGDDEAATDAILDELDPDFRRRLSTVRKAEEKTFGASLRRLRKQRGLRRVDFEPEIASKTVARIE